MNNDLKALRQEVLKRQRAAGKKISAIKSRSGLELSRTDFDPRKDSKLIGRLTTRQLEKQLERLNAFTDRSFQPQRGSSPKVVLDSGLWKEYKQLERKYNSKAKRLMTQFDNLPVPSTGMTVGETRAAFTPDHPVMGDTSVSGFHPLNKSPRSIPSNKALRVLIRSTKRKLDPGYFDGVTKDLLNQTLQMMDSNHEKELAADLKSMSAVELEYLLKHTKFVHHVSTMYHGKKSLGDLSPAMQATHHEIAKESIRDARRIIQDTKDLASRGGFRNNNKRK